MSGKIKLYSYACADAEITFRRQTAAARRRSRPGQGDYEGGTLPDHGESDGDYARGTQNKYSKREQSIRDPEHAIACPRGGDFAEVPTEPRI